MKVKLLFITVSVFIFSISFSQEAPVPVLEASDVDKYVETVVPMTKELKKLGLKMEGNENNPGQQWKGNAEAKAILEKYGWDETFAVKFSAITWAYAYLKIKEEVDKMPEDQKAQVEMMMPMFEMYMKLVHEDDLKKVESKMLQLDDVFQDMEKL